MMSQNGLAAHSTDKQTCKAYCLALLSLVYLEHPLPGVQGVQQLLQHLHSDS